MPDQVAESTSGVPGPAAGASPLFAAAPAGSSVSASDLQSQVDRAANLNMFSIPDRNLSLAGISDSRYGSPIGLKIHEFLHRFRVDTQPPRVGVPFLATSTIGEPVGRLTHRWLLAPDDFVAAPGREPPPTPLDVSRAQRFVMLDSVCSFGHGDDGFRGFGTGQTHGMTGDRRPQLLVTGIGTILEGFGQFQGHEEGTYLYCGTLDLRRGFTGNVMLRVIDSQQAFATDSVLSEPEAVANPEPEVTYLLFRGQAVPSDAVAPRMGAGGQPLGLTVEQGLRLLKIDFRVHGGGGLRSTADVGPPIGKITSAINFNPVSPGGTPLNPIPFTNFDRFDFTDQQGRKIGSFTGNSNEGRVFLTQVASQPAIRFGGTGQILSGDGVFEGISGLLTDNSVVVFTPHVSASIYMLRIPDPCGRFRSAMGG